MSQLKDKLWTKDFMIVSLINFIVILIFYLLMVTIASFAKNEYDASTSQAGLATGIYIVGTLVGRLFSGRVINNVGAKKMMMIGLAAFIVTTALYFVHSGGITLLLIFRLLNGVAAGIASTATSTIIAQIIPSARKAEGIGYFSMSTTLGTAIGPFLGIMLGRLVSYNTIFLFCVILAIIAFMIGLTVNIRITSSTNAPKTVKKEKFSLKQYIEPNAIPIAIVTFLMSLGYAAILSFISFFAEERDLVSAASFFFLVYAVAILVTRPFSGRLMDTKGANAIMVPCFILFAAGLALLSVTHSSIALLVAAAIIGAGYGNLQSGAQAIALKVTPGARAGLATSTFFIALDAGLGFGPYILGFIEPLVGFGALYSGLAILIVMTLVLYMMLHGRKDKQLTA